jgi:hypothetical protein
MDTLALEFIPHILVGIGYLLFWLMVFTILYHLVRFGVGTKPKRFAAAFFLGSILLFSASFVLYLNLDLANLMQ